MGKEAMTIMGNRGAELLRGLIDPLQNPFTKLKNLFKAADEIPSALMHWGESLKDSQEHLKMFSGVLANAYLESQVRGMMRDFGSAQRTGGTTADLIKSLDNLKDDLQDYKDVFTNMSNYILRIGLDVSTWGLTIAERLLFLREIRDEINKWFATSGDTKPAAFDLMDNIRKLPDERVKRPRR